MLRKSYFCRFLAVFFQAELARKLRKGESSKHTSYALLDITILCFVNNGLEGSRRFLCFQLHGLQPFLILMLNAKISWPKNSI